VRRAAAAFVGFILGLLVWRVALAMIPVGDAGVVAAKAAGLVSFTILEGYDKAQESFAWALGCVLGPLGAWTGARLSGDAGRRPPTHDDDEKRTKFPGRPALLVLLGTIVASALRPGFIDGQNPWGTFGFLAEEGVYLGAVQALRTGRMLYVDLALPYGPMLIHPLDQWMRLFGDTVQVARTFVLLCHLLGLAGAYACCRWLLGRGRGDWVGAGVALGLAAYSHSTLPNLNAVLLRPVLAFLPAAALVAAGTNTGRMRRFGGWIGAGLILGTAGMYSSEVAAAALTGAVLAVLLARPSVKGLALAAVAAAALFALVLGPTAGHGSISAFFEQSLAMARLPALGYQALPYPDSLGLFADASGAHGTFPPRDGATAIWAFLPPVLIWSSLALGVSTRAEGPRDEGLDARSALLIAAVVSAVLFRAAFGRSDLYHLWFYGSVPVALLTGLGSLLVWERTPSELRGLIPSAGAVLILALTSLAVPERIRFPDTEEVRLAEKAGVVNPLVERGVPAVPRLGGVTLRPRLGRQVEAIVRRTAALPPDDGVYFYPSEATYHFLTARPLPTRFLWAYDAATTEMQDQAIADLEVSRPRWMFRSTDTFPIDWIPLERLVPRLDAYVNANYRPVEVMPGATLLERVEP
jgi:hypothetical protein